MKTAFPRSFLFPIFAVLTITVAPISHGAAAVVSARCYVKSDAPCTGLFGPETGQRHFSKTATSVEPPPSFEVVRPDGRLRVQVCTAAREVLGAVAQTGYLRAQQHCGKLESVLVLFWQKAGDPIRQEPGVETTTEHETTLNVSLGATLAGGIVEGKTQVGDRYRYTIKIVTFSWICLYDPVIDSLDADPAGFCGREPSILDVACVEP